MRGLDWLWLGVPLVGLVELGGHLYFAHRAPGDRDWRQLKPGVERLRQQDELVVVAPHWAEPLARRSLGDNLMPLAQVARADETSFERAIEVSLLGQRAPELSGWNEVSRERAGPFRLRVLANPAFVPVRFDFVAGLGPGRVTVAYGEPSGLRDCPFRDDFHPVAGGLHGSLAFPAARFGCGGGDQFVGLTIVEDASYRGHRCIWVAPPRRGARVLRYREVPLGEVIRGHTATSWFLMRDRRTAPVVVTFRVDGDEVGTVAHYDGGWSGWNAFEFPLGAHANQTGEVTVEVRSADAENRQFCFQADTR